MSQLFAYFKNLLHPNQNQDRKRRRIDAAASGPLFPKYRRVTNNFPEKYISRIEDDCDHFQQVKRNQHNYNGILEDFVMEQEKKHQKQYRTINDEEFSDEEDLNSVPATAAHNNRRPNLQPSTSGYNFSSLNRKPVPGITQTFSFQQQNEKKASTNFPWKNKKPDKKPQMPQLVPIKAKVHSQQVWNGFQSNGFENNSNHPFSTNRKRNSLFNFEKKNRAFNNSPNFKIGTSVLYKNHNQESRNQFESLLSKVLPNFSQNINGKPLLNQKSTIDSENIATVDLSSDETETSAVGAIGGKSYRTEFFGRRDQNYSGSNQEVVDLSEDDDEPKFCRESLLTSTCIRKQNVDKLSPNLSSTSGHRKSKSSSFVVPQVTPVNSLREKQKHLSCLQDDAIISIVKKFEQKRLQDDKHIRENEQAISKLSKETAAQEKWQQSKIDETLSSLTQCIILDEEEEASDDYPPLTEQQLRVIHFGLHGHRGETIVSKFNMNITRSDLNTLDGLNWLNDEVINFYMELIKLRSEEVEYLPKVHVMNTFFIGKLLQQGHSGVKRWTRKVDIFKCDIIPVPVHVGGVHWCMSIINMTNQTIRYYDSMGHPNQPVLQALEQYLKDESMDKRKIPFDMSEWSIECVRDCPQQRNGSDCGVFSCMFAEFLCRDAKITFDQDHMQYFRRKMVFEIATGKLILGY